MLELKEYQKRALEDLELYLKLAAQQGAKAAFVLRTNRPYREVARLPGLPYVCLRIPTGGGKTLMACHALGLAAGRFLLADRVVCLWLVPTNAIREQTLTALRNRSHPYRQALESQFGGGISIMDLSEAFYVQRGVLDGGTVVIVATLAAMRVDDTEGRKIYEQAGALEHHFTGLDPSQTAALDKLADGVPVPSLANVLCLRRPVVIMDEAHNARTRLSFDTLARFNPSCILEFTATPDARDQNILSHVSAAELKAENMIKLPIRLRTHADWKEALGQTVRAQTRLEKLAKEEERLTGEYLRPIALLQAQASDESLTVDVLKRSLVEDFRVPDDHIREATGQKRGIEGVNLFDKKCAIRFIITIQALKEGWDCSFAYILCSVSAQHTARAVEQILGRILRLPRAMKKQTPELNCAYTFAASPRFAETANALKDALVENGFEKLEAEDMVVSEDGVGSFFELPESGAMPAEPVSQKVDLGTLEPSLAGRVGFDGAGRLVFKAPIQEAEARTIQKRFTNPADREAVERLYQRSRSLWGDSFSSAAFAPFRVPQLAIRRDGHLELFEKSHFLDAPWNLAQCEASLSETEFSLPRDGGMTGDVDVNEVGRLEVRFTEQLQGQMALLQDEAGWTVASLARWIDDRIHHPDIPQAQSGLFVHRVISHVMETRDLRIEPLARWKFALRDAVETKIDAYRKARARETYQALLFGAGSSQIEVSPKVQFVFERDRYAPNWRYEGSYQFMKHYFPLVGELKSDGDEFDCAQFLDMSPDVQCWVRNLERRPESSFWLQTSTDRFYPDFVCLLNDGRVLVVEYKSTRDYSNDDSKEKRALGDLWAERSNGPCLFIMPNGRDFSAIKDMMASTSVEKSIRSIPIELVAVERANPFKTHLPVYSLKAAAGKFSGSQDVTEEGWVKVEGRKLDSQMFVAQVAGKSMEPKIPDGSYCIFQAHPTGSFEGRIVLAQYRGPADPDTGGTYTVKRFRRTQQENLEGGLERVRIWLEPLNSTHHPMSIDLKDNDDIQVVAEFKDILVGARHAVPLQ